MNQNLLELTNDYWQTLLELACEQALSDTSVSLSPKFFSRPCQEPVRRLYLSLSANTITAKLTNHFKQTRLVTSQLTLFTWQQKFFSQLPSPGRSHKTNYNIVIYYVARFVVHLTFRRNWFNDLYWGNNDARGLSINWHLLTLVHKLLPTQCVMTSIDYFFED